MNVTTIEVDKDEALVKYREYLEAEKKTKSREYSAAKRAYAALAKGLKVIDIYDAFKRTGLKADGRPKLAIVRADSKEVFFNKETGGAGIFQIADPGNWSDNRLADAVRLPEGTFCEEWEKMPEPRQWQIKDKENVTNVPIMPPSVLAKAPGKLSNYYILFEVKEWFERTKSPRAKVRDPYLLKRLNDNTFVVLAEWDVSPVEAMVMRGSA